MAMALGFLTVMKILVTMMMMNNSSMVIKGDVIAVDNCTATSTTINSHNHSNSKNPENYKGKYDDDDVLLSDKANSDASALQIQMKNAIFLKMSKIDAM